MSKLGMFKPGGTPPLLATSLQEIFFNRFKNIYSFGLNALPSSGSRIFRRIRFFSYCIILLYSVL